MEGLKDENALGSSYERMPSKGGDPAAEVKPFLGVLARDERAAGGNPIVVRFYAMHRQFR